MYNQSKYLNIGDKSLLIEFANDISEEINHKVRKMMISINDKKLGFIKEIIPTYRSLKIDYDPLIINYDDMIKIFENIEKKICLTIPESSNIIEIPVCYGNKYGEDLKEVAKYSNLTKEEVIKIHTENEYLIYMIGFTPGFPYLGGMSELISMPRLEKPRIKISNGSVGIAGNQTGIYPQDSPGGWQIIGKTPVKLFDLSKENPVLLNAGDYIKFVSISEFEFLNIEKKIKENKFLIVSYPKIEDDI